MAAGAKLALPGLDAGAPHPARNVAARIPVTTSARFMVGWSAPSSSQCAPYLLGNADWRLPCSRGMRDIRGQPRGCTDKRKNRRRASQQ